MIIRSRIVVTMDGAPIENGAVAVSGDRIIDVGRFDDVKAQNAGEVLDLGEQALLPGLINAHCHLDYTCLRGKIPKQESFTDWIRAINAEKEKLSPEDYVASINDGFGEAKRFGTTTIANLTAFPELIARIAKPIRTWWFAELIDVREPNRAKEIVDLATKSLEGVENWGLAPHAPFTASPNLYRRCEEVARLLTTHVGESREELAMFGEAQGPLYEFIRQIRSGVGDCGHETPLERFVGALGDRALPHKWIVAHLNELAERDLNLLARLKTKFHVVHCPSSHDYFGHSPFRFERLRALGFNICLGTDSLASNDNLSLFAEMREFQRNFADVAPKEILSMVTSNSARALRKPDVLGRIRADYFADVVAVPISSSRKSVFDEIIAFDGAVSFSMVNGVKDAAEA